MVIGNMYKSTYRYHYENICLVPANVMGKLGGLSTQYLNNLLSNNFVNFEIK